jgi:Xaa-Pro aminopeptidase
LNDAVDYLRRRQRLLETLRTEQIEALLITNPINVTYLTGFSGESSYLVITRRQTLLVSDGRFTKQITEECPGLEVVIRPPTQNVIEAASGAIEKMGVASIGFESNDLTVAEWEAFREKLPAIAWKSGKERVERLRAVKDAAEIAQIKQAITIAERAFTAFRSILRPSDTEKDLCDALELSIRRAGGKCSAFPSIVAVGARSALPHAPPTAQTITDSALLLVDWGARGKFYNSDLTRVLLARRNSAVPATLDPVLATVYRTVLEAQARAIRRIRPGVTGNEVDAEARATIAAAGFDGHFTHGLGHGLGLQVHEAPALRPGSGVVLEAGMVVTVEPGIYLPDRGGIRIEDDVLVTADGCQVLTSVPRDFDDTWCDLCD